MKCDEVFADCAVLYCTVLYCRGEVSSKCTGIVGVCGVCGVCGDCDVLRAVPRYCVGKVLARRSCLSLGLC